MDLTDPRATAFAAAKFKDAIRFAMGMGSPEPEDQRPTFIWTTDKTFTTADPAGDPYSWDEVPTKTTTHEPVQPLCSVQFVPRKSASEGTPFGEVDVTRAIITMLDDEYETIKGADRVLLGGNTYELSMVAPPEGLFGVTTYVVFANAVDES